MVADISLLEVIFRVLIFAVLVGNLIYLSRTYGIPMLYQQIISKKNDRTEILEKDRLLTSTQRRLDAQIQQQKKMFVLLEQNMQVWRRAMSDELSAKNREVACLQTALHKKRELQEKNFKNAVLGKHIVSQGVALAGADLFDRFKGSLGDERLASIVDDLQRKKI